MLEDVLNIIIIIIAYESVHFIARRKLNLHRETIPGLKTLLLFILIIAVYTFIVITTS